MSSVCDSEQKRNLETLWLRFHRKMRRRRFNGKHYVQYELFFALCVIEYIQNTMFLSTLADRKNYCQCSFYSFNTILILFSTRTLTRNLFFDLVHFLHTYTFLRHVTNIIFSVICLLSYLSIELDAMYITKLNTLPWVYVYAAILVETQLPVSCQPYTSKLPKMCQPDLDFMAPENQSSSACSPQSDMFSLGLLLCSVYNNGRSPIQSNFSTTGYFKQLESVSALLFCW